MGNCTATNKVAYLVKLLGNKSHLYVYINRKIWAGICAVLSGFLCVWICGTAWEVEHPRGRGRHSGGEREQRWEGESGGPQMWLGKNDATLSSSLLIYYVASNKAWMGANKHKKKAVILNSHTSCSLPKHSLSLGCCVEVKSLGVPSANTKKASRAELSRAEHSSGKTV